MTKFWALVEQAPREKLILKLYEQKSTLQQSSNNVIYKIWPLNIEKAVQLVIKILLEKGVST